MNKYHIFYQSGKGTLHQGITKPENGYYNADENAYIIGYYDDYYDVYENKIYVQTGWLSFNPHSAEYVERILFHEGDEININYCDHDDTDEDGNLIYVIEMEPVYEEYQPKYTITFKDPNIPSGGVFDSNNIPENPYGIEVSHGEQESTLQVVYRQPFFNSVATNIPTYTEYPPRRFAGWYDEDGEQVYDGEGCFVEGKYWEYNEKLEDHCWIGQEDLVLHSEWYEPELCNITLYPNYEGADRNKHESVYLGEEYTIPDFNNTPDYIFKSWNTQSDGGGKTYYPGEVIVIDDYYLELYAQWEKIEYLKITYYANNDTDEFFEQEWEKNQEFGIIFNEFTYENHSFIGWNTEPDGTGTSYKEGEMITIAENFELYAQWEQDQPDFIPIIFNNYQVKKFVYNNQEVLHLVFNGIELF